MPWKETDPMPERLQFLAAYPSHVYSMTALCASASAFAATPAPRGCAAIPRQDWRGDRRRAGPRTAAPTVWQRKGQRSCGTPSGLPRPGGHARSCPTSRAVGPRWSCLRRAPPASSSSAGLRQARQRRRGHRHPGALPLQAAASPAVWTAACKGQCRPGDGLSGSPLTVADAYRRVL